MRWLIAINIVFALSMIFINVVASLTVTHNTIDKEHTIVNMGSTIMVDKKILLELVNETKERGEHLAISVFEYNEETEEWRRATWCIK